MCGRFAADISTPVFKNRFRVRQMEILVEPHFNICPGMFLPVVTDGYTLTRMKWGLVPHWSKTPTVKFSNINARAETITTSPAYKYSFSHKRCLIPATGFYEWKKYEDGSKQPYFFQLKNKNAFSFAGIWDTWKDIEGKTFDTCAIITCPANAVVEPVHQRMPVILNEDDENRWLSENTGSLLVPYASDRMIGYRVSTDVNNPHNDSGVLMEPYKEK